MKVFGIVIKIIAALAAIAGIAFVVVKYGDQIVAWFKNTFGGLFCCNCECDCDCNCCEEAPVEDVIEEAGEDVVVAAEADFEG